MISQTFWLSFSLKSLLQFNYTICKVTVAGSIRSQPVMPMFTHYISSWCLVLKMSLGPPALGLYCIERNLPLTLHILSECKIIIYSTVTLHVLSSHNMSAERNLWVACSPVHTFHRESSLLVPVNRLMQLLHLDRLSCTLVLFFLILTLHEGCLSYPHIFSAKIRIKYLTQSSNLTLVFLKFCSCFLLLVHCFTVVHHCDWKYLPMSLMI